VSLLGRPGENRTRRESAPRRRHSFRQRITELAAQWRRRAISFKENSSSNSFSARLRRSESNSAEPFGRIWTSCHLEVHYCFILCEINKQTPKTPNQTPGAVAKFRVVFQDNDVFYRRRAFEKDGRVGAMRGKGF